MRNFNGIILLITIITSLFASTLIVSTVHISNETMVEKLISTNTEMRYAGLFRRLFAIFYDSFLLLAILFIVTAIANALNYGKAIEADNIFYPLYVMIIFFLKAIIYTEQLT